MHLYLGRSMYELLMDWVKKKKRKPDNNVALSIKDADHVSQFTSLQYQYM